MKIPICLRSGTFRRTLRIAVSSLGANPGRGFDVSQYQKYHISSIWCICNHAWITHDIHVQYYVEIWKFSTLVNWLNLHVLFATTDVRHSKSQLMTTDWGHTISIISNLCITMYTNVKCRYHMVFILKSVFKLKVYHIFKRLKTAISSRRHAQIVNLERWLLPDARM